MSSAPTKQGPHPDNILGVASSKSKKSIRKNQKSPTTTSRNWSLTAGRLIALFACFTPVFGESESTSSSSSSSDDACAFFGSQFEFEGPSSILRGSEDLGAWDFKIKVCDEGDTVEGTQGGTYLFGVFTGFQDVTATSITAIYQNGDAVGCSPDGKQRKSTVTFNKDGCDDDCNAYVIGSPVIEGTVDTQCEYAITVTLSN